MLLVLNQFNSATRKNTQRNISRGRSRSRSKSNKRSYAEVLRNGTTPHKTAQKQRQTVNPVKRNPQQNRRRPRNTSVNRRNNGNTGNKGNRQNSSSTFPRSGQNKQRRIHFLVSGQTTPEREKDAEETNLKQV